MVGLGSTAGEAAITLLPERFVRAAAEIPGGGKCIPRFPDSPVKSTWLRREYSQTLNDNTFLIYSALRDPLFFLSLIHYTLYSALRVPYTTVVYCKHMYIV